MEPSAKGVPSRLNSVGLVQKLEASGIGRPSTYATLIDTLLSRGYAIEDDIEEKVYEGDNIKLY